MYIQELNSNPKVKDFNLFVCFATINHVEQKCLIQASRSQTEWFRVSARFFFFAFLHQSQRLLPRCCVRPAEPYPWSSSKLFFFLHHWSSSKKEFCSCSSSSFFFLCFICPSWNRLRHSLSTFIWKCSNWTWCLHSRYSPSFPYRTFCGKFPLFSLHQVDFFYFSSRISVYNFVCDVELWFTRK